MVNLIFMNYITKDEILEKAVNSKGSNKNYVDVILLANDLEISVYAAKKENDFSAEIHYDKDDFKYAIFVNSNHPITRQRFSIAHEIAHFVLHHDVLEKYGFLARDDFDVENVSIMEKEANELAGQMLMPESCMKSYAEKQQIQKSIKKENIIQISKYFKVSKYAVLFRLKELDYYVPLNIFS